MGRRQKVAELGQFPPVDLKSDPGVQGLAWALKDADAAKFFANLRGSDRPDPGWIEPLHQQGLLELPVNQGPNIININAPLASRTLPDHLPLNDATYQLGRWAGSCLDSHKALDWVLARGGVLHLHLRRQIQSELQSGRTDIPLAMQKIWRVLANSEYAHLLSTMNQRRYIRHTGLKCDAGFSIRTFLNCLKPIPVFEGVSAFLRDRADRDPGRPRDWCRIKIELVGIEGKHDIKRLREGNTDWIGALAYCADDLTSLLKEAMDWLHEFDLASPDRDDTHILYPSINTSNRNEHAQTWTQLIALSRDSYDALISMGDSPAAGRLAQRWKSLPYPIFRRLALYAAAGGCGA
jgi:hypothetical protein